MRAFAEAFPDRADRLRPADLVEPARRAASLQPLLRLYDVVHAYAAEPALPLMAGHHPYVAFEHGTLREIPFRQDALGRLTALSYRLADEVIITNGDNRLAAERLGIRRYRFVPHAVSERPPDAAAIERLRRSFREALSADFVVFHPSRQHWDAGFRDPSLEKGNDIFIRGFARFLSDPAVRAGAVFVEWGRKVEESKQLLAACGIRDRVRWIPPLPRGPMCDVIEATEVVADQFVLGAFGSITPQALCARRPALLRFDEDLHRWCFPEPPPVLNASTPDEVCAQLQRVYRNPGAAREIADAGADWYARLHSNAVVRDRLAGVYRDALASRPPARRPRVA
jgi:glycosyltransferase involved in cell wall biosynthesis